MDYWIKELNMKVLGFISVNECFQLMYIFWFYGVYKVFIVVVICDGLSKVSWVGRNGQFV